MQELDLLHPSTKQHGQHEFGAAQETSPHACQVAEEKVFLQRMSAQTHAELAAAAAAEATAAAATAQ